MLTTPNLAANFVPELSFTFDPLVEAEKAILGKNYSKSYQNYYSTSNKNSPLGPKSRVVTENEGLSNSFSNCSSTAFTLNTQNLSLGANAAGLSNNSVGCENVSGIQGLSAKTAKMLIKPNGAKPTLNLAKNSTLTSSSSSNVGKNGIGGNSGNGAYISNPSEAMFLSHKINLRLSNEDVEEDLAIISTFEAKNVRSKSEEEYENMIFSSTDRTAKLMAKRGGFTERIY